MRGSGGRRIWKERSASWRSFLGNEGSTGDPIIFALLYATSVQHSRRVHLRPLSSYLIFSTLSFSRVSVSVIGCCEPGRPYVTCATGRRYGVPSNEDNSRGRERTPPTRNSRSFLPRCPCIVIDAMYGSRYVDRRVNRGDTLYPLKYEC